MGSFVAIAATSAALLFSAVMPAGAFAETATAFLTMPCYNGDFRFEQCWRGNAVGLNRYTTYSWRLNLRSFGELRERHERNGFNGVTSISTPLYYGTHLPPGGDFPGTMCAVMKLYRGATAGVNQIDEHYDCVTR